MLYSTGRTVLVVIVADIRLALADIRSVGTE